MCDAFCCGGPYVEARWREPCRPQVTPAVLRAILAAARKPLYPKELVAKLAFPETVVRAAMWDLLDQGRLAITMDRKVVRVSPKKKPQG